MRFGITLTKKIKTSKKIVFWIFLLKNCRFVNGKPEFFFFTRGGTIVFPFRVFDFVFKNIFKTFLSSSFSYSPLFSQTIFIIFTTHWTQKKVWEKRRLKIFLYWDILAKVANKGSQSFPTWYCLKLLFLVFWQFCFFSNKYYLKTIFWKLRKFKIVFCVLVCAETETKKNAQLLYAETKKKHFTQTQNQCFYLASKVHTDFKGPIKSLSVA